MDKLVAFFKNVWFKRGVSLLTWGYTAMLCWVAWLTFAYYTEYENPTALFVLYVFVHVAELGLIIYTRRQVFTMINCMIIPPIVFLIVFFGFGDWYLIIPPACLMVAAFFICNANETLKTVLGTMYLLMFVIGIAGYLAIEMLMGAISFTGVDIDERDKGFEKLSPSGEYRIVRYISDPSGERRTASYYIEFTGDDTEIPFGFCKKVFSCKHALTSQYKGQADDPIDWIEAGDREMISVEGSLRENPYLKVESDDGDDDDLVSVPAFSDGDGSSDTSDSSDNSDTSEDSSDTSDGGDTSDDIAA